MGYPDYRDFRDRNQIPARARGAWGNRLKLQLRRNTGADDLRTKSLATTSTCWECGPRLDGCSWRLMTLRPSSAIALWQRRFGGSSAAIGAAIDLNGNPFTIVGVAEKGFRGTVLSQPFDLWVPLRTQPRTWSRLSADIMENRNAGWLFLFGRLKPGAGLRQADAEMKTIAAQLARAYPLTNGKRTVEVAAGVGMYPDDRAEVSGLLGLLSGAVALLLAIACSNVAGMLMVRAAGRTREIGIRLAVGANRNSPASSAAHRRTAARAGRRRDRCFAGRVGGPGCYRRDSGRRGRARWCAIPALTLTERCSCSHSSPLSPRACFAPCCPRYSP